MTYIVVDYTNFDGKMSGGFDKFDPLLVSLHDSLKSLKGDRNNQDLYGNVEQSIMNLVAAKLDVSEKAVVSNIIVSIIKQARVDVKRNLAAKLAVRDDLHPSLLHYLAYEDAHIAESVLLNSSQLSDLDILYIIQSKDEAHWRVIAKRPNIQDRVIMCLSTKKDAETNLNLLDNDTITVSEEAMVNIAETARDCGQIAEKLVRYEGLSREVAVSIYWQVSKALREEIVNRFDVDPKVIDQPMEESLQDFSDTISGTDCLKPTQMMIEIASKYHLQGRIGEAMLVNTIERKQGRFFIALFAHKTNLDFSIVETLLRQKSGQGLAVACRALKISKESFIKIFLGSASMVRERRNVTKEELRMAIRYYESLTHKMAKEILDESIRK